VSLGPSRFVAWFEVEVGVGVSVSSGADVLAGLPTPWRLAFEQAWLSWCAGSFGIGAVLVDPADMAVVSVGRNRVAQSTNQPGLLSGNMTAHAEMNAFAALERFNAEGLHVYTTLQPCLMCSATAMMLKVAHVHFAAEDEFYDGLETIWDEHPLTMDRKPSTTGPLTGESVRLNQFARLLPMAFTFEHFPGRTAERLARQRHPGLAVLIDELLHERSIDRLRQLPTLSDGLAALWDRLPR
jgi:tRNA(Arg) A34 adenosine deaminase TadA